MEVHHHPNPESPSDGKAGKKIKHYFFEFFMLFLAVFCGFLAENIREHKVEKDREKQYMVSMVKDLLQDLNNIDSDIQNRTSKHQIADSLTAMMINGDYHDKTGLIYFCARRFSMVGYVFHMTDGTLMQLKNSGGLRLIRNRSVVDSLQNYYNLFQQYEDARELEMLQLRDYRDIMTEVFDVRVFDRMIKEFPETIIPQGNPPLLKNDQQSLNKLLMRVQLSKRINLVALQQLNELKEKGESLVVHIKKEYHLK